VTRRPAIYKALFILGALLACSCKSDSASRSLAPEDAQWVAGSAVAEVNLLGVDLVDDNNGWAVGDISVVNGAVLRTTDGGRNWQPISSTDEILAAVKFISANRGWVAGYAGRIQRTDDGGVTWKLQRAERKGEVLNSIFFLDPERGCGRWRRTGAFDTQRRRYVGDDRYRPRRRPLVGKVSNTRSWIHRRRRWLILTTTDGGREWSAQASGSKGALVGLAVASDHAIAVGEDGMILRTDDFETWSPAESKTTESLNAVAINKSSCWAVGSRGATVGSIDRGRTWTLAPAVVSRDLMAVSVSGPANAIAVGRRGAVQFLAPDK
jgi:photosystem II stability/assembly factor-like uncharacterized protein